LQSSKCTSGKYTFVTAAEDWKTHESYTHDCEALIFAMAASGSLGRTHYIKGKFIASDLCFILTTKRGLQLDLTFYYRLFNFLRSDIVKRTATGTSKLAINQTNFGAYKLPYFNYDHQLIFRDKMEKINDISENFSLGLDNQLALLKQLRQAVLQEAIEGKLTAEWRSQNPELISGENHASKLLGKIKAEKERLIKEGKIKKNKLLPPVTIAEKPFPLPAGWVWCRLPDILDFGNSLRRGPFGSSITKSMFVTKAKHLTKVYEQKNAIYKDCTLGSYFINLDEHPDLKGFLAGPGDILISCAGTIGETYLLPKHAPIGIINQALLKIRLNHNTIDNLFFMIVFNVQTKSHINDAAKGTAMKNISSVDYLKHELLFPLPPLAEQQAIVERVEELIAVMDELEKQVNERKEHSQMLMQSVLKEAFEI